MTREALPVSLVVTSFNEVRNVLAWCKSLLAMDTWPSEIIVADSDSTDGTVDELRRCLDGHLHLVILHGRCSISEGRNKAISAAANENVVITDFGVTFDRSWLRNMHSVLVTNDWAGGCYIITAGNPIQNAFARLFDVEPERLVEASFLPSSRSFGVRRSVFIAANGYDTSLVLGEDTALVSKLRGLGLRYQLARNAVVHWHPRESLHAIYVQNYRYAYWDGRASQNAGRWLHIAFWIVISMAALTGSLVAGWQGAAGGLAVSAAILYAKVAPNTLRCSSHSLPQILDLVVYYTTTTGSALGYLAGSFARLRRPA